MKKVIFVSIVMFSRIPVAMSMDQSQKSIDYSFCWGEGDQKYWKINPEKLPNFRAAVTSISSTSARDYIEMVFDYSDCQKARTILGTKDEFVEKFFSRFLKIDPNFILPPEMDKILRDNQTALYNQLYQKCYSKNYDSDNFHVLLQALLALPLAYDEHANKIYSTLSGSGIQEVSIEPLKLSPDKFNDLEVKEILNLMKEVKFLETNICSRDDVNFSWKAYNNWQLQRFPQKRILIIGCGAIYTLHNHGINAFLINIVFHEKPDWFANVTNVNWWKTLPDNYFEEIFDESNTGGGLLASEVLPEVVRVIKPGGKLTIDCDKDTMQRVLTQAKIAFNSIVEENRVIGENVQRQTSTITISG